MVNKGTIIYEPGNSINNKTGSWRVFKPILDNDKCIKCENCYIFCPEGCIQPDENGDFKIDYDYCKGCLICEEECPVKAITGIREEK
ncbi:pyruvate ferredoxin oxidoreductase delta subunit [Methanococcus voltae]|jgi:pyruvate ferredoxin oxidoreductase delta subunit|uniref:Pyruvate synthase subunit PorD n=3 Tax=Methanococcus voltae TaxID=2188 RepID=D7DUC3_METV3|nr:pyruvate synthase subunit PorD [Methanococcus voltae]MBP2143036.1 pyruvate ferredoxin oxidoreductase delta subunit [Methanococcus voltae]MBP2172146.1 pyruvate ferredoxin oxidoreductase delta subunit [Methanococcus voltae]MBP2200897.1 pyruvate ferredoxin oxidoreductase delta subunit [Methanococcus voltae]MCS3900533.1 pyruvate ferredoxin oxidoreductase delta subunit [Methanococcus voltae]MCS3921621.1 pyruvate ferredoxin oxidoreductase delta subunit [Methanococcus voltae PS]